MFSIKTAVDTLVLWKIFVSKTKKNLNFLGKMDNFQLGTISDWNLTDPDWKYVWFIIINNFHKTIIL